LIFNNLSFISYFLRKCCLGCFCDSLLFCWLHWLWSDSLLLLDVLLHFPDISHCACESFRFECWFQCHFILFILYFRALLFSFQEFMIKSLIFCFNLFTHFLLLYTFLVVCVSREWINDISYVVMLKHRQWLALFNHNLITDYTEILCIMHLIFASLCLELLELWEPISVIHFHLWHNNNNNIVNIHIFHFSSHFGVYC